jgi:predicted transcriptional regulator
MTPNSPLNYLELTADLVSAYVRHNSLPRSDLASLIDAVHAALRQVSSGKAEQPEEAPRPPVPIRKSITPDHLISLEDGKPYRSLTRHLAKRGLTPVTYRQKWGLPPTYPMVAPNYSKRRSEVAKALGLGQRRGRVDPTPTPAPEGARPGRGRRRKAA